jgi:hypothetical protein
LQRPNAKGQRQGKKEEEEEEEEEEEGGPLNRFTTVKTWPTRPAYSDMEMQRSVSCHNWHDRNDGRHNFSQRYSTTGRFQIYSFTLRHCRIVTDRTIQKELTIYKIH